MQTVDEITAALEAFIQRESGDASARVSDLRRLTGGASRETWAFDAVVRGEQLPLILQRDVRGGARDFTRATEYELMRAAFAAGVQSPEPMWLGDGSLGGEFFIVRRVEGETLPRRLLRDERWAGAKAALTPQLGAAAAKIHAIPLDALPQLPHPAAGKTPAQHELDRYETTFRAIAPEAHPVLELAFRFLRTRMPSPPDQLRLVHGDFRMGNVLFGEEGARLILDWELAHAGDSAEDLAWMIVRSWRFGGAQPVGGIGTREEFFAAYEAAGGGRVDPERVRWWEIYGNLRWGISCIGQAKVHLDGVVNSMELAAIGRRTAETEWELLELVR
jgi:aminoglycoside phosphotransferase (APT) family kinase protein